MSDGAGRVSSSQPAAAGKPATVDPVIGRTINDRFKIVSLLARGGMGKVYRAEQLPLGRQCAIKILNPGYAGDQDPEFHKRFFLEASVASKLTHPNTVTIFDYGRTDDDIYYIAMELLEGVTLHRAIRVAGVLAEERVTHISMQVCRALREAHGLGVIHRDLKPANVFLLEHGDEPDYVKILDFGLVKEFAAEPAEQLTQTGLFMGSPKYMAPEQIRGDRVDARTDIYSLGVIMYEMLCGKVPFDRPNSVNILMAHVNDAVPPMRSINPNIEVSEVMEHTVMRCMSKDPDQRFSSMDEVLVALKTVVRVNSFAPGALGTGQHGAIGSGQHGALGSGSFPTPGHVATISYTPGPATGASQSGSIPPLPHSTQRPGPMSGFPMHEAELPKSLAPGPRKSRALAGLIAIAAIIGVASIFFVVGTTSKNTAPTASANAAGDTPADSSSGAAAHPTASTPDTAATLAAAPLKVRVSSEPEGANVREDGREVCASTPCDVSFASDGKKTRRLLFVKNGFRNDLRDVGATDGQLTVKLAKAGGGYVPPKQTATPDHPESTSAPEGFKDLPY
jgi:eukaryotic-like serine/threonine-protein kinase